MAYYTILFSPTGGTKQAAEILAGELFGEQRVIDLCDPAFSGASLDAGDAAIFAIPSYAGRVPCTAAERMARIKGNGAKAILLCVYGNRAFDNTLAEMKDQAEKTGFRPVAAVAALAEHSMTRKVAAGRPDDADVVVLQEMAAKIKAKLDSGDSTPVQVPGSVPDQSMGNFGGKMAPKASENCSHCGICAMKCPTQAIDAETMEADKGKCIGCMRCISVCPSGSRKMSVILESLGGVALSVLCSHRKENALFL